MVGMVLVGVTSARAGDLSLGVDGSSATSGTIGGAMFSLTDIQPTGTGVIDPFLRVDVGTGATPYSGIPGDEQGYNTDNPGSGANATMDDKAGIWTHSIQLGRIGTSGGNYVFLLDANQTGSNPALTLDAFKLYLSIAPKSPQLSLAQLGTPVFSIGANQVNFAVQNTGGNDPFGHNGSGSGDLYVYVPISSVGGTASDYLTLYCDFGNGTSGINSAGQSYVNYPNNDGFEEWAVRSVSSVPDGGTPACMLGMALLGIEGLRRKIRA